MCSIDYPSDIVSWRPPAAKDPATDPTSSAETEKEVNYIDVALDTTVQACKHHFYANTVLSGDVVVVS